MPISCTLPGSLLECRSSSNSHQEHVTVSSLVSQRYACVIPSIIQADVMVDRRFESLLRRSIVSRGRESYPQSHRKKCDTRWYAPTIRCASARVSSDVMIDSILFMLLVVLRPPTHCGDLYRRTRMCLTIYLGWILRFSMHGRGHLIKIRVLQWWTVLCT